MLALERDVKGIYLSAVSDCVIMGGDIKTDAKVSIAIIISHKTGDLNKPLTLSINLRHITRPRLFCCWNE